MRLTYVVGFLLATAALVLAGSQDSVFQRTPALSSDPLTDDLATEAFAQNGCHSKSDALGGKCGTPFREINFKAAAEMWCAGYGNKVDVPIGQSFVTRITMFPCDEKEAGCDFVGNLKFDRDTDNRGAGNGWNFIDEARCLAHMDDIWTQCGGHGGWWNTEYGTVFMECAQPI